MAKKKKSKSKPNVFMQSYQVAEGKYDGAAAVGAQSRTESKAAIRKQIYTNTYASELRRFGVIAGALTVCLVIISVLLNLLV